MSGKLFLSGGGRAKDSFLLDKYFVESLNGKRLLYIPVGLIRGFVGYDECYSWITTTLAAHTKVPLNISMWVSMKNRQEETLDEFGAIYIGGGSNTYRLLDILNINLFASKLKSFYNRGGNIYGGSAGAIIMGKSIATVEEENNGEYDDEHSLDLVGGYSIRCHYNNSDEEKEKIYKFLESRKTSVIAIPLDSGIVVGGGVITVCGYTPVTIFDPLGNLTSFDPGCKFSSLS